MTNDNDTVLVTGYAPAPKGTVMQESQRLFGVVVEVDRRTHRIVAADIPGVTELSKDFFRRVAVGYDLSQGVERLAEKVRVRYWTSSTDALIACLKIIGQRFEEGQKRTSFGIDGTPSAFKSYEHNRQQTDLRLRCRRQEPTEVSRA